MGRIFKDCFEMIREMDRELKVSGITVPVNHYQNQELSGDDRLTKELIGVSFVISKPYLGKREMLDFMFKDEAELIEKYCRAELSDRLDRNGVNPGKSWEIRRDLWQKLVSKTRQGVASTTPIQSVCTFSTRDPKYTSWTMSSRLSGTTRTPDEQWS